ncbi:MAG: HNH endonuclease [Gammaproteobacteria bacterium]
MATQLQKARAFSFVVQSGRCVYCNLPMWEADPDEFAKRYHLTPNQTRRFKCTAEHLTARCDGGPDSRANIAAACMHCNSVRHRSPVPLPALEYQTYVRKRVARGKWPGFGIPKTMHTAPQ